MSSIINLIALFTSIFRIIGNAIKTQKAKKIILKLESNSDFRNSKLIEMGFTIGKKIDPDYIKFFNSIKRNAINIQTEKYQVKSVVDIDVNTFLIFVVCIDTEIEVATTFRNKSSKYVKLMYFKTTKTATESKVDVKSYFYNDNNEKYLMTGFFSAIEKLV
jgi:hypothetical protein